MKWRLTNMIMYDKITQDNMDAWLNYAGGKNVNMLEGNCVECGANILVHPKETKVIEAHYCIDCRVKTERKLNTQDLGDVADTEVDKYISGRYDND